MCFSAGASFGASALLCVVGVLALKRTTSPSQVMFAAIPLIFSAQQFTEGVVWLALANPAYNAWKANSVFAFLFFAQVLWPLWASLAVLSMETDPGRKKTLWALAGVGLAVSLYLAHHLASAPATAHISSHHIYYAQNFPIATLWFSGLVYFLPTVAPLLISSVKNMWIMGLSVLLSYLVTHLFYAEYLTSVWCYFAAVISIQVLLIIRSPRPHPARETALRPNL